MLKVIKVRVEELQDRTNEIKRRCREILDNRSAFDSYDEWEAAHKDEEAALRDELEELRVRLFELTEFAALQSDDKDAILKHFAVRLGPTYGELRGGLLTNPKKFAVNIDEINRAITALNATESPEMTVLYENDEIIVKKTDNAIYAGYKGRPLYRVWGVIESDFTDDVRWTLNFKQGGNVVTNFRFEHGVSDGLYLNNVWYKNMGDGRFVSDYEDGERTRYEALLVQIDLADCECTRAFLMGWIDEVTGA